MFVSSLTNSDFSSFWLYPNFCHKKHLVFFFLNKLRLFDKNSALFIFQCTICAFGADCVFIFTQFLPLLRGFYCLTDSLFIISHFHVFVKYFFKLFWSFLFLPDFPVASQRTWLLYHIRLSLSRLFLKFFNLFFKPRASRRQLIYNTTFDMKSQAFSCGNIV